MKSTTAYDFSQFAPSPQPERQPRVTKAPKIQKSLNKALRRSVFMCVLLIALMTMMVYSQSVFSETKAQVVSAEKQLSELQSEYTYLSFELESMVSLKNAEEYAVSNLGLVKVNNYQIAYVNLQQENVIVGEKTPTLVESIGEFFSNAVMDLFS